MNNEPRFYSQNIHEEANKPDLQDWVDTNQMEALVDETKGGIIGYINFEHIGEITELLNNAVNLLTDDQRKNLLTNAIEGGSNYWYYLPDTSMCNKYRLKTPEPLVDRMMRAIVAGESIPIHHVENETELLGTLNMEFIRRGEQLMYKQQPKHFANILSENDDAETADVWFQFCVLGKIVFG